MQLKFDVAAIYHPVNLVNHMFTAPIYSDAESVTDKIRRRKAALRYFNDGCLNTTITRVFEIVPITKHIG